MLFSCPVLGRTVASLKICRLCFCPINSVLLNLLYVFRFCFRMLAVILVLDLFIFYTQSREIPDKCACLSPRASSPAIATCWRTSWPVISGSLWEWTRRRLGLTAMCCSLARACSSPCWTGLVLTALTWTSLTPSLKSSGSFSGWWHLLTLFYCVSVWVFWP